MENHLDCQLPISSQCNIELDKQPVASKYGVVPDKIALYNKGNGDYLSTVSKQSANLMRSYAEFCKMLSDGIFNPQTNIVSNGLNPEDIKVTDALHMGGKKFSRIMEFPKHHFDFGDDRFHLRLWAWTAYDLYWAEQFIFGPLCIACLNGMFTAKWKIKGMSKKNWNNKASIDDNDITMALKTFNEFPEELERLATTNVEESNVKHLFENTLARIEHPLNPRVSEYRMKELSNHWDNYKRKYGMSMYAVYQTATAWASHPEGRGTKMNKIRNRSSQLSKMMKSQDWLVLFTMPKRVNGNAPTAVLRQAI